MTVHAVVSRSIWLLPVVLAICALMVLPAGALLAPGAIGTSSGTAASANELAAPSATAGSAATTSGASATSPGLSNLAASLASSPSLLTASKISGSWVQNLLSPSASKSVSPVVSYPNLYLLEHPVSSVAQTVLPSYVAQPAPMGIADFGLGATPYSYSTPHFEGAVTFSAPPNVTDPGASSVIDPGAQNLGDVGSVYEFGIQLNTVLTNVSIPGTNTGVFWTQNVVNVNDTGIHFVDDIFNLSTGSGFYISPGNPVTIASGCGLSSVATMLTVYGGVYQCVGTTIPISSANYPLTIALFNNASVTSGNNTLLTFGYDITGAGGLSETGISDMVTFNNPQAPTQAPPFPPGFTVSGTAGAPAGLLQDAEFDLVGSIGGANAVFRAINGTLHLEYSNATVGAWQSVPSAYNFGDDTGETSTGIAGVWSGTTESIDKGPSFLYGLWNAVPHVSVSSGSIHFHGTIAPTYGFVFVSNVATDALASNFSWVPTTPGGDFNTYLPPSVPPATEYYVQAWAAGEKEYNGTPFDVSTDLAITMVTAAPGAPIQAPLYMNGNAQAVSLASALTGSAVPPYTFKNLVIAMNLTFNHLNDYGFPTFVIFSAEGITNRLVVDDITQGNDSALGNFYYYDMPPAPGPTGLLTPGPWLVPTSFENYTEQIQVFDSTAATITNESFEGNTYFSGSSPQGGSIFLWDDTHAVVRYVTVGAGPYGFSYGGVIVGNSRSTTVQDISVSGGSNGVDDTGSYATAVTNVTATGLGSFGVFALSTDFGVYSYLNSSQGATGFYAGGYYTPDLYYEVPGVTDALIEYVDAWGNETSLGATYGADLYYSAYITAPDFTVNGTAIGFQAILTNVIIFNHVSVDVAGGYAGSVFEQDFQIFVSDVATTGAGPGGPGIYALVDGTVTLNDVTSTSDAESAVLLECTYVTLDTGDNAYVADGFDAEPSSIAVTLDDFSDSAVVYVVVSNGATGVLLEGDSDGNSVSLVFASNNSFGVLVETSSDGNTISTVTADGDSTGVSLSSSDLDTVSEVTATNGSVGVGAGDSSFLSISQVTASNASIGVDLGYENGDFVSNVVVTNQTIGVLAYFSTNETITDVNATNTTLSSPWDPVVAYDWNVPLSAVETFNLSYSTISGVVATDYPVGLYDGPCSLVPSGCSSDYSHNLVVQGVNVTDGWYAIVANYTEDSQFIGIDAFHDYIGIATYDDSLNVIVGGRFVDDTSYGVSLYQTTPGSDSVWLNAFVGDNGATSTYDAAHIQAYDFENSNEWFACYTENGVLSCRGNYWSDWHLYSSPGVLSPYFIPRDTYDYYPLSAPPGYATVVFETAGLPSGTSWSLTFDGSTQSTTASSVQFTVLPGSYPFSVGPIVGYSVTPSSGNVTAAATDVSGPTVLSIAFTPVYSVTVQESGLPTGTSWTAVVGGVSNASTTPSIGFTVAAGTYEYQIAAPSGYTATPSSGSITVSSSAYTLLVTFAPTAGQSTVTVVETGLPSGTSWTAVVGGVLNSSTTGSIGFTVATGTYDFQIGAPSGYAASPSSGSLTVSSSTYTLLVTFTPTAPTSTVTVSETGLPGGTSWTAIVGGVSSSSTTSSILVSLPAGTYSYQIQGPSGYTASPSAGSLTVWSSTYSLAVAFSGAAPPTTVTVTVTASGLPAGTSWSAIVGGVLSSSTTSSIAFTVAPGMYSYQILPVSGYTASPSGGTVTVGSADYSLSATFTPLTYAVTISESGLASGTGWSASVNGVQQSTGGTSMTWYLSNGTYDFVINAPAGYTLTGGTGSIVVNGSPAGTAGGFTSTVTSTGPSLVTSSTFNTWFGLAIIIAVIALLVALVAVLRRRPDPPPPAAAWSGPKTSASATSSSTKSTSPTSPASGSATPKPSPKGSEWDDPPGSTSPPPE